MTPASSQILSEWTPTAQSKEELLHLQRLAIVGGLTSQVAHELNNNLTALLGWAQQAQSAGQDADFTARALSQVTVNAERAVEICRGLLGLSRAKDGPSEMLPINDLIKDAITCLEAQLKKSSIALRCRCPDDLAVYGRKNQLVQVLLNMLVNSHRAMAEAGGMIAISASQDPATHCVTISITDTGPGIPPQNIRRIFEPFFTTAESADPEAHRGTGLGLAVCRDIIVSHGGFIEVKSEPGRGATFNIFLPGSPT